MRLKVYRANGMTEAMTLVREDLGADALILSTHRVAGGIEVTAALDRPDDDAPLHLTRPPMPRPLIPRPPMPRPSAPRLSRPRPRMEPDRQHILAWHGIPGPLAGKLAAGPLPFALSAVLRFRPLALTAPDGAADRAVLLCGPPGAGKTLTAARLAARLVLAGTPPCLVTMDDSRAGAAEQLAAIAAVLGLTLHPADQPRALRELDGPVLIDTAGCDPFDTGAVAALRDWAREARAEPMLVLPAGLDPMEAADIAAAFRAAGVARLIATRLDLTRRLGGVLAAAHAGLALAEAGIGPGVANGLIPAGAGWLARRIMRATQDPPTQGTT